MALHSQATCPAKSHFITNLCRNENCATRVCLSIDSEADAMLLNFNKKLKYHEKQLTGSWYTETHHSSGWTELKVCCHEYTRKSKYILLQACYVGSVQQEVEHHCLQWQIDLLTLLMLTLTPEDFQAWIHVFKCFGSPTFICSGKQQNWYY